MMVEHHTKYKEIHGYDKTIWMTKSDHQKHHNKLRKEGKCNISVTKLKKISIAAWRRSNKGTSYCKDYEKKVGRHSFFETMMPYVILREQIWYNNITGNVTVNVYFEPGHSKKLLYVDID